MKQCGIDIGSRTIKFAVIDNNTLCEWGVVDATSRPLEVARGIINKLRGIPMVATGYGRHLLECRDIPTVTEIKACAYGVRHWGAPVGTIIDIGGQDLKVISLNEYGKIEKFEMNDRCAAGTGKFLELMAATLEYALPEFGETALRGKDTLSISSLCAVFAESEVVGLINRNEKREDIAYAVHKSVIEKITSLYARVAKSSAPVALIGGGALNPAIMFLLKQKLNLEIVSPKHPQIMAALGAGVIGYGEDR